MRTLSYMVRRKHTLSVGEEIELFVLGRTLKGVLLRRDGDALVVGLSEVPLVPGGIARSTRLVVQRSDHRGVISGDSQLLEGWQGANRIYLKAPLSLALNQRRAFYRMDADTPVTLKVEHAQKSGLASKKVYHHHCQNLSGGGISLETELGLVPKDRLRLTFWPNRKEQLIAEAVVAWTHESGDGLQCLGIAFTEIGPADQDRLVGQVMDRDLTERRQLTEWSEE